MDSDSESRRRSTAGSLGGAGGGMDFDDDASGAALLRRAPAVREQVLQLESESDEEEERDRVGEIRSARASQPAVTVTVAEKHHAHTASAPSLLSFLQPTPAAPAAAFSELHALDITPPPDKQGWLYKRGNVNQSWKKRWFVLRYQTLKYYSKPGDSKPKGFISLSAAALAAGTSDKMRRLFGFEITSLKYTRVFVIHAEDAKEMQEWMGCLQANIDYVSHVIEREKKQNASANGAAPQVDKALSVAKPSFAPASSKKEQLLQLQIGEDYLRSLGVAPRLSQWRRDPAVKMWAPNVGEGVATSSLRSAARLPSAGAYGMHNTSNAIAVGRGAHVGGGAGAIQLLTVDTRDSVSSLSESARFGDLEEIDIRADDDEDEDELMPAEVELVCSGEVASVCWVDDRVFAGSSGGVAAMWKASPEAGSAPPSAVPTAIFPHHGQDRLPQPSPGQWTLDSRVRCLSLNSVDKRSLLSVVNRSFFVWDVERVGVVSTSQSGGGGGGSGGALFAAGWSNFSASEFMYAGEDGTLRLGDTRMATAQGSVGKESTRCATWQAPKAHTEAVRDLSWSPLVSHWVASASDDGLVKLWDLRFGSEPVRVLSGHTNAVTSVSWSRSHAELLVSASIDRTTRVWNARVGPHYTIYSHPASSDDFHAPLLFSAWSPVNPFQSFVGSANGEVVAMHLSNQLLAPFANHRALASAAKEPAPAKKAESKEEEEKKASPTVADDASSAVIVRNPVDEALEREIETLVFLRDFERAYKAVAILAHRYWQQGQHAFAETLLKLTGPALFAKAAAEHGKTPAATATATNSLKAFNQLVNDLSRFIPSTALRVSKTDPQTHQRLQFLKTRLTLLQFIKTSNYRGILELGSEICSHLERSGAAGGATSPTSANGLLAASNSPTSLDLSGIDQFDSQTLEKMALAILPHDHIRGLEFCLRIAKTLKEHGNFALFIGIARVVFNPTIFERMDPDSPAAAQYSYLRTLSALASTPIGAHATAGREESRSESESDTESSTNSVSSSMHRKQSMDVDRPTARAAPIVTRPSVSVASSPVAAAAANQPAAANNRGSVGNEAQHAQITLDRDLRNAKIVLAQLTLLHQVFSLVAAEEDANNTPEPSTPSGNSASAALSPSRARVAAVSVDSAPARFNPYLAKQHASVKASLDTLGMPPLSSDTAKAIIRLMEEHAKEPTKLLSAVAHFMHFYCLLQVRKYDIIVISATKINSSSAMRNYQFANVLEGVVNEVTVPKFSIFLQKLLAAAKAYNASSAASGTANTIFTTKLQPAILTTINIFYNCDYLPDKLAALLPRFFHEFKDELRRFFTDIKSNPDYVPTTSYSSAKEDLRTWSQGILGHITRIQQQARSKLTGEPHQHEAITSFIAMVKTFQE